MSEIAIGVENLSKCYRIGLKEAQHDTLVEAISSWLKSPISNFRQLQKLSKFSDNGHSDDTIWALKDVSFEVRRGEVLGVIGRNGVGKSTLLKILSRITEPTSGRVMINGRVSSLLEVGTGFHPELTGRENVYLNGAILGMGKHEIDRKFDEIVAFAEVEKFIDTPVKRYSSGMKVRLAFAVAAHLEPDILLVDEVLAVGDAIFQKKCLGKMHEVSGEGRTVLYVSHNMQTITRLCDRAILLGFGRLLADGDPDKLVTTYLNSVAGAASKREWPVLEEAPGNEFVRVRSVRVVNKDLLTVGTTDIREKVGIEIIFDILKQRLKFVPMIALFNEQGVLAFNAMDTDQAWSEPRAAGRYTCIAWIPGNFLSEGTMSVTIMLSTHAPRAAIKQAHISDAVAFQVVDPIEGDSARGNYVGSWGGAVRPLLQWTVLYSSTQKALTLEREVSL